MARRYGARQSGPSAEFARAFNSLPRWEQDRLVRQVRDAFRAAKAAAEGDENHQPCRTNHDHYHVHGLNSNVKGLDSNGGHAHLHSHGMQPSTQHGPVPDNDHGHAHDDSDYYPGDSPENPGYQRPDGQPGTSGKARHIRFAAGEMQVLASARRALPVSPAQRARQDAAWGALAGIERTIRRSGW